MYNYIIVREKTGINYTGMTIDFSIKFDLEFYRSQGFSNVSYVGVKVGPYLLSVPLSPIFHHFVSSHKDT